MGYFGNDSDDEYEPSQLDQEYKELSRMASVSRPVRKTRSDSLTRRLYDGGGLLDSQTSDTQWIDGLLDHHEHSKQSEGPTYADVGVQVQDSTFTSPMDLAWQFSTLETENEVLKEELTRLRMSYDALEEQLESVRTVANHIPVVLDPAEESQVEIMPPMLSWKTEPTRTK
ncbi:hypothetical protein BN946_scf184912.g48 [Trametes cinnabarina]|uniref:Uncharacterized protein n=1 Tax=Pycnoporus cinnabarinus TaxID=5643 RepID=A0A060SZ47_PYCCI|nr:hypothetical protein BN946_scf184912.g48 [Trametes cinnabarina]